MRRRTRVVHRPPSHDRWLVSYADFITLLFAVFAVLYASSTVDARKLSTMIQSMQSVFGDAPQAWEDAAPMDEPRGPVDLASLAAVRAQLARAMAGEIKDGQVSIDSDSRGVVVSIRESGSYPSGSADLPPAAEELFLRMAAELRSVPNAVRVEGHTDDVPIQTMKYGSNWELSTARATSVVALFVERGGIDPSRLSAAGYGQFRPRVPNESVEGRARNRRVDVVILNAATRAAEEPGGR